MAIQVFAFAPKIPAGTTQAALFTAALAMPPGIVEAIEVHIPPGPNGLMGFAIGAAGQPVIPYNAGAFIVGNDDYWRWELQEQFTSGAWQFFGYNGGIFDHSVFLRFLVSPPALAAPSSPAAPLDAAAIDQAPVDVTPPELVLPPDAAPPADVPVDSAGNTFRDTTPDITALPPELAGA